MLYIYFILLLLQQFLFIMSRISKCLLSSIQKRSFPRCTFYTGPESFPDYTGKSKLSLTIKSLTYK